MLKWNHSNPLHTLRHERGERWRKRKQEIERTTKRQNDPRFMNIYFPLLLPINYRNRKFSVCWISNERSDDVLHTAYWNETRMNQFNWRSYLSPLRSASLRYTNDIAFFWPAIFVPWKFLGSNKKYSSKYRMLIFKLQLKYLNMVWTTKKASTTKHQHQRHITSAL